MKIVCRVIAFLLCAAAFTQIPFPAIAQAASGKVASTPILVSTHAQTPALPQTSPLLTILCYHHVGDKPGPYCVSPKQLSEQLDILQQEGFSFVSSAQVEEFYAKGASLPLKSALVSFDDGDLDVYEHAWPLLKARGIPFTFFIYPAAIHKTRSKTYISWDDLREMAHAGVTIGSHSMTHPLLTSPDKSVSTKAEYDAWLAFQLADSKAALEQELGQSISQIAIPYGAYDRYIYDKVREAGYTIAYNTSGANNTRNSDPLNLNRIIVMGALSNEKFAHIVQERPLRFIERAPADLSHTSSSLVNISFSIEDIDNFNPSTAKASVGDIAVANLHYVEKEHRFIGSLALTHPSYYYVYISINDKAGQPYRDAWLFKYEKTSPLYMQQ